LGEYEGENFLPASEIKTEASPAALLGQSRAKQNTLFLLEEFLVARAIQKL